MLIASLFITGFLLISIASLSYIAAKLDSRGYDGDVVDYNEHHTAIERVIL